MKPKKRKNKRYLDAVKLRIIQELLEGHLTKTEVASKYGITTTHITYWMRKFNFLPTSNTGEKMQQLYRSTQSQKDPKEVAYLVKIQALKAKIQRLNQALKESKMCAEGYKTILEITEKELNVSLLKKTGAKQ